FLYLGDNLPGCTLLGFLSLLRSSRGDLPSELIAIVIEVDRLGEDDV
ncbi:MAG TPA: citrate synthase, partial [Oxalobacteraceae bacterium]|nr:citrate synthase [Oxalobacteraceae bacterium]